MLPIPAAWRIPAIAVAALSVFAAGGSITWFAVAAPRIETALQTGRADLATCRGENQQARADGLQAGRDEQDKLNQATQRASDERARELARLAGIAAAKPPTVIRVCPQPAGAMPAPGDGQAGAAPGGGQAGGLLPGGAREDPGAVLGRELERLALEADNVTADLRATVKACGGAP